MKLEDQVTNRELSERLRDLGVPQESLLYWYKDSIDIDEFNWELAVLDDSIHGKRLCGFGYGLDCVHGKMPFDAAEYVSAFTVAELGEMIGTDHRDMPNKGRVNISFETKDPTDQKWKVTLCLTRWGNVHDSHETVGDTEADARAKMLIYLIENKLVTV